MIDAPRSETPLTSRLSGVPYFSAPLKFVNHLTLSPETVFLGLALFIGLSTGLGVLCLHGTINVVRDLFFEDFMSWAMHYGSWTLACVPVIGGLCVSLMRWYWKDFGPNMATFIQGTRGLSDLSLGRAMTKAIAAAVSIGTGASLGPEGPSVEIGAYVGSALGHSLKVSQERQRLLLGAGAAAGLAAGFNAPIAGVFLALEVILGSTFVTAAASVLVLAAVLSAFVAQLGLGGQPAFTLPAYEVLSLWELPLYLGLGVLACLVSLTFSATLQAAQALFRGEVYPFQFLSQIPVVWRPILGGIGVGIVALQYPHIMGIGYETIESMLQDVQFPLYTLGALLIAKLFMTALSLGSGLVGGVFAPALFLGAALGAAYGKILGLILPSFGLAIAAPPAYAMVGMAAVLAGVARAPLTAILLLFEMTRDYRIVLPLMAAVSLSFWFVECLQPKQPQATNLEQLGLSLEVNESLETLSQLQVQDAMHVFPLALTSTTPLLEAGKILLHHSMHTGMILNPSGELIGLMTLNDIGRAIAHRETSSTCDPALKTLNVGDVCTQKLVTTYADESLSEAVARMATRGLHQLPVVERQNPKRLVGLLTQEAVDLLISTASTRATLEEYIQDRAITVTTVESLPHLR
jgi:H+/Cl- antiporter ClcA/CBS domain-containing protein